MVTAAPATTAPEGSFTTPLIVPELPDCAKRTPECRKTPKLKSKNTRNTKFLCISPPSPQKGPSHWAGSAAWIGPLIKAAALISNRRQSEINTTSQSVFAVWKTMRTEDHEKRAGEQRLRAQVQRKVLQPAG